MWSGDTATSRDALNPIAESSQCARGCGFRLEDGQKLGVAVYWTLLEYRFREIDSSLDCNWLLFKYGSKCLD